MSEPGTAALRSLAPAWSLAGDQRLLAILQDIHQNIISKCQETNSRLDEMVSALDDANVHLQNVNNRFMALSNSQFVESRVYEDDIDVAANKTDDVQAPPPAPEPIAARSLRSLRVLNSMHSPVQIQVDSDSDSDSGDERHTLVLRPRDVYSSRPLPHVIGSKLWREKWHVGLVPEDSDSDSSRSSPRREVYSESDVEPETIPRAISSGSSEAGSEPTAARVAADLATRLARHNELLESQTPVEGQTPSSAIAADLARRLTAHHRSSDVDFQKVSQPGVIDTLFKPHKPTSTIFSDEPPPLPESDSSEDEDVFAELLKSKLNKVTTAPCAAADDLFGGLDKGQITSKPESTTSPFGDDSDSQLFGDKPSYLDTSGERESTTKREEITKKPVGGISVFGKQHAESIGAAILKRTQRLKSHSESDEDKSTEEPAKSDRQDIFDKLFTKTVNNDDNNKIVGKENVNEDVKTDKLNNEAAKTAKQDILEKLFTKPSNVQKNKGKPVIQGKVNDKIVRDNEIKEDSNHNKDKKVDIFSDDIFDDMDDIFSNVTPVKKSSKAQVGIFDDTEDLFADVATNDISIKHEAPIKTDQSLKQNVTKTNLFDDSDEELFADTKKSNVNESRSEITKNIDVVKNVGKITEITKKEKSIFDDSSDDEYDLFNTKMNITRSEEVAETTPFTGSENIKTDVEEIIPVKDGNVTEISDPATKLDDDDDKENSSIKVFIAKDKPNKVNADNTKNKNNIFEDNDDKIDNSVNVNQNISNEIAEIEEFIDNNVTESNLQPTSEENKTEINETENINSYENLTEAFIANAIEDTNIFAELPPDFEKPKEAKRSKNVNALFDDDSDDDTSFFRKTDPTLDEKPEILNTGTSNPLFGIFNAEPPAVDVDFSQKSTKTLENDEFDKKSTEELFETKPVNKTDEQNKKASNQVRDTVPNEQLDLVTNEVVEDFDGLFTVCKRECTKNAEKSVKTNNEAARKEIKDINTSKSEEIVSSISETKATMTKEETKSCEKTEENTNSYNTEKKSVGKLKPMNFNINVNTLLPGASPKKTKSTDKTDGQIESKSCENLPTKDIANEVADSHLVKSVSFDGEPDSKILDNKLSKDRPRIQVKRRPSTRRARVEAARKSAIEFGEDSTDNSSSIDDVKPKEILKTETTSEKLEKNTEKDDLTPVKLDKNIENHVTPIKVDKPTDNKIDDLTPVERKAETKVIYILNDEDIFGESTTKREESESITTTVETVTRDEYDVFQESEPNIKTKPKVDVKSVLDISDDDDDLFKLPKKSVKVTKDDEKLDFFNNDNTKDVASELFKTDTSTVKSEIKTLGNVYSLTTKPLSVTKLEEKKAETRKIPKSIFDDISDDDDNLFRSASSTKSKGNHDDLIDKIFVEKKRDKRAEERRKIDVKAPLFGDDSDEDLFSSKPKKVQEKRQVIEDKNATKEQTSTQVFDDPLSMFDDD